MALVVGLFLARFLPAIAAALLCLARLLASEEMSSAFPDLGVEESSIHTPTHSCLHTAAMETAPHPTDLSADWKVLVGGGSCVIVGAWKAARL